MLQVAHQAIEDIVDDPDRTHSLYTQKKQGLIIIVARGDTAERFHEFAKVQSSLRELGTSGVIPLKPQ